MTEIIARRRWFTQIPDALIVDPDVTGTAIRVWARLDWHAGKRGDAMPSRAVLAEELRISEGTVKRALAELAAAGWITRRQIGDSNDWETVLNDEKRVTDGPFRDPGRPGKGSRVTRFPPGNGSSMTPERATDDPFPHPYKEGIGDRRTDRTSPAASDGHASDELDLNLPPPQRDGHGDGQTEVQILVGAYAEAVEAAGGVATTSMRGAIGKNLKRLMRDDHLPLPMLLVAVQRAGSKRDRSVDRHLGEARQSYARPSSKEAMVARWYERAARIDAGEPA